MVEEISTNDVNRRIENGDDVQVIDIRQPDEFAEGHVPGALNVPMSDLPSRVDEIEWGEDVVVACPIGQSSIQAARLIDSYEGVEDGAKVRSMAGGYDAWDHDLETSE